MYTCVRAVIGRRSRFLAELGQPLRTDCHSFEEGFVRLIRGDWKEYDPYGEGERLEEEQEAIKKGKGAVRVAP